MHLHLFFEEHKEVLRRNFTNIELGRLYTTIPFRELPAPFRASAHRKPHTIRPLGAGLLYAQKPVRSPRSEKTKTANRILFRLAVLKLFTGRPKKLPTELDFGWQL